MIIRVGMWCLPTKPIQERVKSVSVRFTRATVMGMQLKYQIFWVIKSAVSLVLWVVSFPVVVMLVVGKRPT